MAQFTLQQDIRQVDIEFLTGEETVTVGLISNDEIVGYALRDNTTGEFVALVTGIQDAHPGTKTLHGVDDLTNLDEAVLSEWRRNL